MKNAFVRLYLMGSQQRCASVHVVFRLKHVHHLVRVQFEHALHPHAVRALLSPSFLDLLLLRIPATLALSDASQVPTKTRMRQSIFS